MKLLLTGFGPFNGEQINPSWEVVRQMPELIGDCDIIKAKLPTAFRAAAVMMEDAMSMYQPNVVLSLGLAGGRYAVSIERVAINMDDANKPDVDGNKPEDMCIREDGAPAYFSTLPIKNIMQAVLGQGVPANISNSAGTFVCNHTFYTAMYLTEKRFPDTKVGFIHLPYAPIQVLDKSQKPFMSIQDMCVAVRAALNVIVGIVPDELQLELSH